MRLLTLSLALLLSAAFGRLDAQAICYRLSGVCSDSTRRTSETVRASLQQTLAHNGKWLTAAGVAAFTFLAAREHNHSRREWTSLLTICRSAPAACEVGPDGRYLRSDAEALYQRSRAYDRRANRWLVGAQLSLIATTALFIIDLHPGEGPENIPFPSQIRVGSVGSGAGVAIGYRLPAIR